jgi:hypothetical protein
LKGSGKSREWWWNESTKTNQGKATHITRQFAL